MSRWLRILAFLPILPPLLFIRIPQTLAQTEVTVSFTVGETILTLSGQTSPEAVVTFKEAGAVVGTTTVDEEGNFSKSLFAQSSGVHTIGIYATDSNGLITSTITFSVSLTPLIETTVFNIILPPTISLSRSKIIQGETLEVSGLTVPVSNTTLFITSSTIAKTASSSTDGVWLYVLDTSELESGSHDAYAQTTTKSGYQSQVSQTKSFQVLSTTASPTPTGTPAPTTVSAATPVPSPSPTLVPGTSSPVPSPLPTGTPAPTTVSAATPVPSPSPTLVPGTSSPVLSPLPVFILPGGLVFFDINGSGRLEVDEVSQAVRRWVDEWRGKPTENTRCDVDGDGRCDLVDFSVLLFWIGK